MAKEIPEDRPVRPRGFAEFEISGHQMPIVDAPGVIEAQEALRNEPPEEGADTLSAAAEMEIKADPFDHDGDGKPGGSLPKAQRK